MPAFSVYEIDPGVVWSQTGGYAYLVSPKYFVVNVKFAIIFNLNNFAVVGIFAIATLNSEILKMGLVNHAISAIDKVWLLSELGIPHDGNFTWPRASAMSITMCQQIIVEGIVNIAHSTSQMVLLRV